MGRLHIFQSIHHHLDFVRMGRHGLRSRAGLAGAPDVLLRKLVGDAGGRSRRRGEPEEIFEVIAFLLLAR